MGRAVAEYMEDGLHADEVCQRHNLTRRELAHWCNWMDFRATWVDPNRRAPFPDSAPDYAATALTPPGSDPSGHIPFSS